MLLRCIRAEREKLRRSGIWLLFLAIPVIAAVYGTFNYNMNLGILTHGWYDLWTQYTLFYATFFFGPLIGVYASYLWRLEHRGHNWNVILAAPVRPMCLFAAKFWVVMEMTLLTQLWLLVLFVLGGKLGAGLPGLPPAELVVWLLRGTMGSVAIVSLQLLLSMVISHFALPVLIALGGSIGGLLMTSRGWGLCWPYALMLLGMNSNKTEDAMAGQFGAMVVSCAAFSLAFWLAAWGFLRRKDVKA